MSKWSKIKKQKKLINKNNSINAYNAWQTYLYNRLGKNVFSLYPELRTMNLKNFNTVKHMKSSLNLKEDVGISSLMSSCIKGKQTKVGSEVLCTSRSLNEGTPRPKTDLPSVSNAPVEEGVIIHNR